MRISQVTGEAYTRKYSLQFCIYSSVTVHGTIQYTYWVKNHDSIDVYKGTP